MQIARNMGLASLGRIAIDGSRIKANASRKGMLRYEKFDDAIKAIRQQIDELRTKLAEENRSEDNETSGRLANDIASKERRIERIKAAKARLDREYQDEKRRAKTRVALNDTDARFMGRDGAASNYIIGYNCQASVDSDRQIIVAAEIHDSPQDAPALLPMIEKTKENCGESPKEVLADKGYCNSVNIVNAENQCEDLYLGMATAKGVVPTERSEQIFPGRDGKSYDCMAGKQLRIGKVNYKQNSVMVLADENRCDGCVLSSSCMLYPRRNKCTVILDLKHSLALGNMARRARTAEFNEVYKQRKAIVEPAFGNIKWNKMLRLFVSSRKRASAWWKMVCTAHNIEKIIKTRPPRPRIAFLAVCF